MGYKDDYLKEYGATFSRSEVDSYLEHHGIKGQKWGVRRFQNMDGTLTLEGRRRRLQDVTEKLTALGKSMRQKKEERARAREDKRIADAVSSGDAGKILKYSDKLSNSELEAALQRADMTKKLKDIDRERAEKTLARFSNMAKSVKTIYESFDDIRIRANKHREYIDAMSQKQQARYEAEKKAKQEKKAAEKAEREKEKAEREKEKAEREKEKADREKEKAARADIAKKEKLLESITKSAEKAERKEKEDALKRITKTILDDRKYKEKVARQIKKKRVKTQRLIDILAVAGTRSAASLDDVDGSARRDAGFIVSPSYYKK